MGRAVACKPNRSVGGETYLEALEGAVVGIEEELGSGAELRRAVPPVIIIGPG